MRGISTNNYAESGIRILKDIVFQRVKAYNLIQLFELKGWEPEWSKPQCVKLELEQFEVTCTY